MALTASTMLPIGTEAFNFALPDVVNGQQITLEAFQEKTALLIIFLSRHCPYVQHVKGELAKLGRDFVSRSVGIVAICSNDAAHYPEDSPAKLKEMACEFNFPLCHDESQAVAKSYKAACTPDFFLFDQNRKLVYRGQLDDSRPGNDVPVTGRDLRAAVEAVLEGKPVSADQRPSLGCNIKWKPGQEPAYAN